jgi:acyl carrier protein
MTGAVAVDVRIRTFILERFPLARKHNLKNSDALLESGILDSLGILDVVGFLEREFGIHIADDELLPENFKDVDSICAYVSRKEQRAGSSQ